MSGKYVVWVSSKLKTDVLTATNIGVFSSMLLVVSTKLYTQTTIVLIICLSLY